ncbi:MAG: Gfo/Idh/MocA family oxidoreductase [Planctomycetes bacterium]|nr:Gfo/Idh/MocA family oxidoreductase [Planctomycetota bacterium]
MQERATVSTRRHFLKTAAVVAGAPYVITSAALGNQDQPAASERITMAGIGMGGRGRGDMNGFMGHKEVQFIAVCDVKKAHREGAKVQVDKRYGNSDCDTYVDFRDVVARDDIDAVLIGTPDHWHALIGVAACKSGKDVFCEKPLSLTIKEGRAMVQAARRYGRVFSSGSQRVLGDYGNEARKVQSGEKGQIHEVFCDPGGPPLPCNLPGGPAPDDVDWDMWLGPAPWAPYNAYRCGGAYGLGGKGFRTWYDYSGGMMTDWGGHKFGGAMFALGLDHTGPTEIIPPDGKDVQHLTYKFECGIVMYRTGGGPSYKAAEGNVPGLTWQPPTELLERGYQGNGGLPGDFLHCVKTRDKPFRDVEYGHRVATVCHLGNIAYELKRPLKWDPVKEEFPGDEEANRMTWRPMREPWCLPLV